MCMFCAAVPVAASVGAAANVKQHEKIKNVASLVDSDSSSKPALPIIKLTLVLVILLVSASVVYHTVVAPRLGIW